MKRIFLIICFACAGFFYEAFPAVKLALVGSMTGMGTMSVGTTPSSNQPVTMPVEALQNPGNVEVIFLTNLGSLSITVVNSQGYPVYQMPVYAVSGGKLTIDTQGWRRGSFTLIINYGQGRRFEGRFNIE